MFTKILAPVDFDRNAARILQMSAHLAAEWRGKVFAFHVVKPPDPFQISGSLMLSQMEREARDRLEMLAREHLGGVEHLIYLNTGFHPASIIVGAVRELSADLVVMATHGRTGVARLVLGSVAEHVVRGAPCPVLVINHEPDELAIQTETATATH